MDARPRTKAEVEALFCGGSAGALVFDEPRNLPAMRPLIEPKPGKPWRPGQPAAGDPA